MEQAISAINQAFGLPLIASTPQPPHVGNIPSSVARSVNLISIENASTEDHDDRAGSELDIGESDKWANLFDNTKLAYKGVKLGFVAPIIKDGKHNIAQLQQTEIDKMSKKWDFSMIILYVMGETPTIAAILRFIYKD